MIDRILTESLSYSLGKFPVVCITGPRQCGKTTLAKALCARYLGEYVYLDLERVGDMRRMEAAELFFADHRHQLVVIDEVQRLPELFPQLRAEVDADRRAGRFLLLGSASPDLIMRSAETLAGRVRYVTLTPFLLGELGGQANWRDYFFWGGFPPVVLDPDDRFRREWLDSFIFTYLERDLPMLGLSTSPVQARRLWEMLAYQSGSLLNSSALGRSLGISYHTVSAQLDYFEGAYMVRRVQPYTANIGKRLVKSPKVYLTDTGILHRLLGVGSLSQLMGTPHLGNSWETLVVNQVCPLLGGDWRAWFYRTHGGAEVDLVLGRGSKAEICVEIKFSSAPKVGKGLASAIADLGTAQNFIVIPEGAPYRIRPDVTVCGLSAFLPILMDMVRV